MCVPVLGELGEGVVFAADFFFASALAFAFAFAFGEALASDRGVVGVGSPPATAAAGEAVLC